MFEERQIQFSTWPNCQNGCKFCLRKERDNWDKDKQIARLEELIKNVDYIDWSQYTGGVSILGGEVFFVEDCDVKDKFLEFINKLIDKVIIPFKTTRISTVTNGIYDPNNLLFPTFDLVQKRVGIQRADLNVSYDIKYRFSTEERRLRCIQTINELHDRYNYCVGVQTILTQYLIDAINNKEFNIQEFEEEIVPGNLLTFLYPHPINPILITKDNPMDDFKFNRKSFIDFMLYLKKNFPFKYDNFYLSTINSSIRKLTGARDPLAGKEDMQPVLSDGKEIINEKCNHSTLYQCYADCDKCMLCDLLNLDR